jgi:hypothetical protein
VIVTSNYFTAKAYDRAGKLVKEFKGTDRTCRISSTSCAAGRLADLYGPILEGHLSSALCHLGNISHVLGKTAAPAATKEKIKGDKLLTEAYGRMAEHLAANGVSLDKTPATLGVTLTLEAKAERFTGPDAAAANALLTRNYRAPFVVPQLA